jgi:hypothetical protein
MAADDKLATLYRRPNKFMEDGTPRNIAIAYGRIPASQRGEYYIEYQGKNYEGDEVDKLPR